MLYEVPVLLDSELAQITRGVMDRSMTAHDNRDTDAAIAELAEGYAWMHVFEEGYQEVVSGLETVEKVTRDLYEGDALKDYLGANSQPIAIVGNLGVQLDLDIFENEDGSQNVTKTLSIYEVRDGKLLRMWAFFPTDPDGAKTD